MEGLISLKEILQQLVQEYAESPPTPCSYAEIPEKLIDGRRETVRLELLFELLLREQEDLLATSLALAPADATADFLEQLS